MLLPLEIGCPYYLLYQIDSLHSVFLCTTDSQIYVWSLTTEVTCLYPYCKGGWENIHWTLIVSFRKIP